jgi:hypothetical protein
LALVKDGLPDISPFIKLFLLASMIARRHDDAAPAMDHDQESCNSSYRTDEDGAVEYKERENESSAIAKNETKNVGRLKVVVASVLIVTTIAVATIVYLYLSRNEHASFHNQFHGDGSKIFASIGASMDKTFGVMDNMAVMLVAHAKETNLTWPFVTLPNYGIRAAKLLLVTDALSMSFLPVVSADQRRTWESYSLDNDDCVSMQESWDWYNGPILYDGEEYGVIRDSYDALPYNVRYYAVWKTYLLLCFTTMAII